MTKSCDIGGGYPVTHDSYPIPEFRTSPFNEDGSLDHDRLRDERQLLYTRKKEAEKIREQDYEIMLLNDMLGSKNFVSIQFIKSIERFENDRMTVGTPNQKVINLYLEQIPNLDYADIPDETLTIIMKLVATAIESVALSYDEKARKFYRTGAPSPSSIIEQRTALEAEGLANKRDTILKRLRNCFTINKV